MAPISLPHWLSSASAHSRHDQSEPVHRFQTLPFARPVIQCQKSNFYGSQPWNSPASPTPSHHGLLLGKVGVELWLVQVDAIGRDISMVAPSRCRRARTRPHHLSFALQLARFGAEKRRRGKLNL